MTVRSILTSKVVKILAVILGVFLLFIKVNTRFTKKGKIMITNLENIICV